MELPDADLKIGAPGKWQHFQKDFFYRLVRHQQILWNLTMESSTNDQELKSSKELDAYHPEKEYLLAEYTALRAEMQSRSQAQRQLLSLAFVISGTLLTFGVTHNTQDLYFLIPLFLFFLAVGWGDHDRAIKMISSYIREQIEPYAPGLEWANSIQQLETEKHQTFGGFLISTHVRGTFLLLELLPIGLVLSRFKWEMRSIVLLGLDVIAIILTWFVLKHRPRMMNILSIGIGTPLTGRPSHTTQHTGPYCAVRLIRQNQIQENISQSD